MAGRNMASLPETLYPARKSTISTIPDDNFRPLFRLLEPRHAAAVVMPYLLS
jgi:hypothetical protein